MKKIIGLFVLSGAFCFFGIAQELKFAQLSTTEFSKEARNGGIYAGTIEKDGLVHVIMVTNSKKEGKKIDHYSFGQNMNFEKLFNNDFDNDVQENNYPWYIPKEKVESISPSSTKWLKTGRKFGGGLKFNLGKMKKNYNLGIFTHLTFEEEDELKAKTGDIWRINAAGFKSTSKVGKVDHDYGFREDLNLSGYEVTAPAGDPLLAAGVITEKVRTKGPWEFAGNRIAIMAIDGNNFDNSKYNIYINKYTAVPMASGLGQDDLLCALFAPLNGPTNVASLKHLYWKDKKNVFSLYRFTDNYTLADSVSFISKLMWGQFEILNGNDKTSTFIVGKGKSDFDGWARPAMQVKKIDGVQITKVESGKVIYNTMLSEDDLKQKLIGPAGQKVKFSMQVVNNNTKEVVPLPNGDHLILGRSPMETYVLQMSASGDLKAFYFIPPMDAKTAAIYNHQAVIKGNNLYLVLNEQPISFSNQTKVDVNTTAYARTTTVSRLNEVYVTSQVVRINFVDLTASNALQMNGKNFYAMGSYPALIREDAIYFTGCDKGPGSKTLTVARIDY